MSMTVGQLSNRLSSASFIQAGRLSDLGRTLSAETGLGDAFKRLAQDADRLKGPGNFPTAGDYADALKKFADDYNAALKAAKDTGGSTGTQASKALDALKADLAVGAGKSGFTIQANGALKVDAAAAQRAFSASPSTATALFGRLSGRISISNQAIQQSVALDTRKLQADMARSGAIQSAQSTVGRNLTITYTSTAQLLDSATGFSRIDRLV